MSPIAKKYLPAMLVVAAALTACGKDPAPTAAPQQAVQPAAGASPIATPPAAATKTVDQWLADARKAESENRTVAPAGDNAMEYYLQVLALEEKNDRAVNALIDMFPLGATQAEREIANRNVEEAQRVIDLLDRANPDSYTVSTLKSKLNAARSQIQREEDRRLAQEAEAARREAAAAAPAPEPTQPVASASRPTTTTPPPAATPEPATTTPEPQPVATAPALPSRDAVLVRTVRPGYPPKAARARQEGWVEVQFTVGADGKVGDVKVVRGEPARVFDREAIRAVQQWEFQPAVRDGQPAAMTMTRRIEFKLGG